MEALLLELDGIQEAAVVGIPDDEWGERVVAILIGAGDAGEIKSFSAKHLAPYKRPREIHFVDDLPT